MWPPYEVFFPSHFYLLAQILNYTHTHTRTHHIRSQKTRKKKPTKFMFYSKNWVAAALIHWHDRVMRVWKRFEETRRSVRWKHKSMNFYWDSVKNRFPKEYSHTRKYTHTLTHLHKLWAHIYIYNNPKHSGKKNRGNQKRVKNEPEANRTGFFRKRKEKTTTLKC